MNFRKNAKQESSLGDVKSSDELIIAKLTSETSPKDIGKKYLVTVRPNLKDFDYNASPGIVDGMFPLAGKTIEVSVYIVPYISEKPYTSTHLLMSEDWRWHPTWLMNYRKIS